MEATEGRVLVQLTDSRGKVLAEEFISPGAQEFQMGRVRLVMPLLPPLQDGDSIVIDGSLHE